MIRGYVYMVLLALIIIWIVISEVRFRKAFNKYWRVRQYKSEPERADYYLSSIPIAIFIYIGIAIIIGMIYTWNDPI